MSMHVQVRRLFAPPGGIRGGAITTVGLNRGLSVAVRLVGRQQVDVDRRDAAGASLGADVGGVSPLQFAF